MRLLAEVAAATNGTATHACGHEDDGGDSTDAAIAMELGVAGVLMNTAIAAAKDPVAMAHAMRHAVIAGSTAPGCTASSGGGVSSGANASTASGGIVPFVFFCFIGYAGTVLFVGSLAAVRFVIT